MTGSNAEHDPIREAALDWLLQIEAAPDDEALRAALVAWRRQCPAHEAAYRSVARVWRLAGDLPSDYVAQVTASPSSGSESDSRLAPEPSIAGDTDTTASKRRTPSRRRLAIGALAVALAICIVLFMAPTLPLHLRADYVTGVGESRTIELDDGSSLHLDAESAVAVRYGPSQRTVQLLAGQAFFDVLPVASRPFTVPTPGLTARVTGTGFAVGMWRDRISVTVQSGAVEVALDQPGGQIVRLARGEQLTLARATGAVTRSSVRPADIASCCTTP